jgi:hypothetical protein
MIWDVIIWLVSGDMFNIFKDSKGRKVFLDVLIEIKYTF